MFRCDRCRAAGAREYGCMRRPTRARDVLHVIAAQEAIVLGDELMADHLYVEALTGAA